VTVASFQALKTGLMSDYAANIESGLPTQYPNAPFTKPTSGLWALLDVLLGDSSQIEIAPAGARTFRVDGVLAVAIFSPLEEGEGSATTKADTIADRYRATTRAGCLFRAPTVEPGVRQDGWWRVTVKCPFHADRAA
jgi:hypothetical protein